MFSLSALGDMVGTGRNNIMRDIAEQDDERRVLKQNSVLHGRYAIQNVLGIGGFAIVYLADDIDKNSKVAIKEYFPYGKSYRMNSSKKIAFKSMTEFDIMHRYALFENEADILKKCQVLLRQYHIRTSFMRMIQFILLWSILMELHCRIG